MLKVDRLTNALVKELQGWNEDLDIKVEKDTEINTVIINDILSIFCFDTKYSVDGLEYNPEELSILVEDVLLSNF
jgi:hypothetical protein